MADVAETFVHGTQFRINDEELRRKIAAFSRDLHQCGVDFVLAAMA
jgi:hypothetical protein